MSSTPPSELLEDIPDKPHKSDTLLITGFLFGVGLLIFIIYVYICMKSLDIYTGGTRYRSMREFTTILDANEDGTIRRSINEPPPPYPDEEAPGHIPEDQFALPPPYPVDGTAPPPYTGPDLPPPYPGIFHVRETRCGITELPDVKSGMED